MSDFIMQYKEAEIAEDQSVKQRADAFKNLRAFAGKAKGDAEKFLVMLQPKEDAYMEEMYGNIDEAKKADGSWKYRRFLYKDAEGNKAIGGLPPAYVSSKSTLKQAMELDITIAGVPKTDLGKNIASSKQVALSTFHKARRDCEHLTGLWPNLTAGERDALRTEFLGAL